MLCMIIRNAGKIKPCDEKQNRHRVMPFIGSMRCLFYVGAKGLSDYRETGTASLCSPRFSRYSLGLTPNFFLKALEKTSWSL